MQRAPFRATETARCSRGQHRAGDFGSHALTVRSNSGSEASASALMGSNRAAPRPRNSARMRSRRDDCRRMTPEANAITSGWLCCSAMPDCFKNAASGERATCMTAERGSTGMSKRRTQSQGCSAKGVSNARWLSSRRECVSPNAPPAQSRHDLDRARPGENAERDTLLWHARCTGTEEWREQFGVAAWASGWCKSQSLCMLPKSRTSCR